MTELEKERIELLEWFMADECIIYVAPGKYKIEYEDDQVEHLNHEDLLRMFKEHKDANVGKEIKEPA